MRLRDVILLKGFPKTITVTDEEIREALKDPINAIVDAVRVGVGGDAA